MRVPARVLAAALLTACHAPSGAPEAPRPVTVDVRAVEATPLQDVLDLDGVVAAGQRVDLVARVAGVLERIHVPDGARVRRGQPLFTLEQAPYDEQVRLQQARLQQARSDHARQADLLDENASSQASVDLALSTLLQAESQLALAQINRGYTEIRAPFDGILGRHRVDAGNYVGATAGGTVLGTVQQLMPAHVDALAGERDVLRLRERLARQGPVRAGMPGQPQGITVRARLQGSERDVAVGQLDFVDRQFGTGTLAVRGRFDNADLALVPGQSARLLIELGPPRQALLLPRTAVLDDPQGQYVYVVDASQAARRRAVDTVAAPGERREILRGLTPGERVVVSGAARLADGRQVRTDAVSSDGSAP